MGLECARSSKNGTGNYRYSQRINWVNLNHSEETDERQMVGQFLISSGLLEECLWEEISFKNFKKITARQIKIRISKKKKFQEEL